MGHVRVNLKLSNPERIDGTIEILDALVDTGATWTTLPRPLAQQLGLNIVGQIRVRTASGVQVLDQSYAHILLQGKSMVESVLIIDTLETVLVGVRTLEGMGWAVDPSTGELKESDILLLNMQRTRKA